MMKRSTIRKMIQTRTGHQSIHKLKKSEGKKGSRTIMRKGHRHIDKTFVDISS